MYGLRHLVFLVSTDPFDIIYNPFTNNVEELNGLKMGEIGYLLRTGIIWICLITIMGVLISLFFVHKSDLVKEKKQTIEHKLWVLFIAASAVTLFDIAKKFFDSFFFIGG